MFDTLKNTLFATIGIVALTQERLQQLVDDLVRRGQITAEQGKVLLDEILSRGQSEGQAFSQRVSQEFSRLAEKSPFPTRKEFARLEERVRTLETRLAVLESAEAVRSAGSAAEFGAGLGGSGTPFPGGAAS